MLGWVFSSHRFSKGFSSIWCSLSSTSRFVIPQDRHRPRDASSDLANCSRFSRSAITNHSFLAPYIATIGDSVQGSPLLLNKWESPSSHSEWFRLQGPCLAPGLGPSPQDRHRPSDASSDLALAVTFQGALSRTICSWRRSCDYRRLRSRESPSPLQVGVAFKGFPLSIVNGFASRGSPSPSGWDSPQGVPPLSTANGIRFKGVPFSKWKDSPQGLPPLLNEWIRFMGVPFSKANGIRLMEVPTIQGVPFSKWMRFTSRGSPSPQRMGFASGESPSPKRMGFASWGSPLSRGFPSPSEWDSPQGAPPLHSEWDSLQGSPLLQSEWDSPQGGPPIQCEWESPQGVSSSPMRMGFASRGSPSPKRMVFASRDSPSPQRQCFASTNPASSRHQHSSRASSEDNPFERPHLRSSLTNHLPFQRR